MRRYKNICKFDCLLKSVRSIRAPVLKLTADIRLLRQLLMMKYVVSELFVRELIVLADIFKAVTTNSVIASHIGKRKNVGMFGIAMYESSTLSGLI